MILMYTIPPLYVVSLDYPFQLLKLSLDFISSTLGWAPQWLPLCILTNLEKNTDLDLMDFSDTTIGMGQRANSTFQYLDYGPTLNGSGIGPAAGTISTLGHASPRSQQQQQQQQQQSYQSNNDVTSLQQNAILMPVYTAPTPTNGSSTLTEFTKRRNWSQRVIEELKDFLHILTPDGRITYVSPSVEFLLGYKPDKLVGHFIHDYIHTDDHAIYVREFNESIASGNSLRLFYRFRKADGSFAIFETVGHAHLTSEQSNFVPQGAAGFCRGFFMMARPYPTKNANLLDSFLEHKIENERLTRKIADLKREEREEDEAQQRHWATENPISNADVTTESEKATTISLDRSLMPPPAKPPISNILLTKENLLDVTASFKQDSINDKMARYEGATHIETIEMLTGLRYRDGERSKGISTGDASPTLIRGDAGIAISADKDGKAGDKKKKLKVADEYVCTDCGTLDSPEWRKGPSGPKTLCNACGCESYNLLLLLLLLLRLIHHLSSLSLSLSKN